MKILIKDGMILYLFKLHLKGGKGQWGGGRERRRKLPLSPKHRDLCDQQWVR